jgi:hypothetical protein
MTAATTTTIDAWLFPLVRGAAINASFVAVLGPGDAARVARIGPSIDRDRSVCARVAARVEVGRRLRMPAHLVPLASVDAPYVIGHETTVSWSHSGDWLALAIADELDVGIDIERAPDRFDLAALADLAVGSLEEFVGLEAASKATACAYNGAWPPGVGTRRLAAPHGYAASVAAPGHDWRVELHMRSPLEYVEQTRTPSLSGQQVTVTVRSGPSPEPRTVPCS